MPSPYTVIVSGADPLADALSRVSMFAAVVPVASTSGLRDLLASRQLTGGVADKIFVFSDRLRVDTPQTLPFLLTKLVSLGGKVMVLDVTGSGRALAQAAPGVHVLPGPWKLNTVLGGMHTLSGDTGITPVPEAANSEIVLDAPEPAVSLPDFGGGTALPTFTDHAPAPAFAAGGPATPAFGDPAPTPAPAFAGVATDLASPPAVAAPRRRATAAPFSAPEQAPEWASGQPLGFTDTAREEKPPRLGFVIVVTAPKGGTGKSTLSLNLAAYLGLKLRGTGRNVCIVDANIQQADTGKYLNAYTPNVEDLLQDSAYITPERITEKLLHKPQLNMSALLGPATPDAANPFHYSGRRYSQILEALKPNFDYIIIDTPVAEFYHDMFRTFALPVADSLIIAVTPNLTTLHNSDMWLRQITAPRNANGMGFDRDKIGIVLNRAEDGVGVDEDEVRNNLAEWRYLGAVPETKEWKYANNLGEIVATKNYSELNNAFASVLSQVTGEEILAEALESPLSSRGRLFARFFKRGSRT